MNAHSGRLEFDRSDLGELIKYLGPTPIGGSVVPLLVRGEMRAWHATISPRQRVGQTLSIFRNLGGIVAENELRRPRFAIEDIAGILRRPDCQDQGSRESLDWLIQRRRLGGFDDWRLTVLSSTDGPILIDGNKRAAAIYETAPEDLTMPVCLLTGPRGEMLPAQA